jgi:hypothetical protein
MYGMVVQRKAISLPLLYSTLCAPSYSETTVAVNIRFSTSRFICCSNYFLLLYFQTRYKGQLLWDFETITLFFVTQLLKNVH